MSNIAISVENLSKKYVIGELERYYTIRDSLTHLLNYPLRLLNKKEIEEKEKEFIWALKDISFEVQHGDIVGIIGRNGAGKSTLLKILSRITSPTEGVVKLNGRVGSLLEVGTGFHPELTGRENIFLNGSILGMSKKEIERKFDEIVDFAEIEKFLDTPVKRYSSGMYVRLAFAVAAHMEPEILVVDEVLSVGDIQFQKKCLGKMKEVSAKGRTVMFVSHNMPTISSLCEKSMLLESGRIVKIDKTSDVILSYYNEGENSSASASFTNNGKIVGDEFASLISATIFNQRTSEISSDINIDEPLKVSMCFKIHKKEKKIFVPNFHFYTVDGVCAFVSSKKANNILSKGEYVAECHIPENFLNEGTYYVGLALSSFESGVTVHFFQPNSLSFHVKDPIDGIVTRHGYGGVIPGTVRPDLNWEITEIS